MFGILFLILIAETRQSQLDNTYRDVLYDIFYNALFNENEGVIDVDPPKRIIAYDSLHVPKNIHVIEINRGRLNSINSIESEPKPESSAENYEKEFDDNYKFATYIDDLPSITDYEIIPRPVTDTSIFESMDRPENNWENLPIHDASNLRSKDDNEGTKKDIPLYKVFGSTKPTSPPTKATAKPGISYKTQFFIDLLNTLKTLKNGASKSYDGAKDIAGGTMQGVKAVYNGIKSGIKNIFSRRNGEYYREPKSRHYIVIY